MIHLISNVGSGTGTLAEPPALVIVADMENPAKLHKTLVP